MRRHPPFAALRAFEAAARLLSFKAAASELGLTPTAVSHQIKQLERLAGRRLFVRRARQVELTPDGSAFAQAVGPPLDALAAAYSDLCSDPARQSVTLGAGPIFSARWLVPRLADFWAAHPGIDLRLHHSPLPVWQQMAQFDLAVAWGRGGWPGLVCEELLRIEVTPVLAPSLLEYATKPRQPDDVLGLPLLHHRDAEGWRQWFAAAGVGAPGELPGTVFEDSNVLLQAALSGRGVALGVLQFIQDELTARRLIRPFKISVEPEDAYFLIHRKKALKVEAAAVVRRWLLEA